MTRAKFQELYSLADRIFDGDTDRVKVIVEHLDDAMIRTFMQERFGPDDFNQAKIVLFAYLNYGRDATKAWRALNSDLELSA
ncbi:MAG TPA: hypothetical protein VH186_04265 [Chloroflexia bacterium]|nr:hypothetical protein [Chloroflexia bacterium]